MESLLECAASGSTQCSSGKEAGVICLSTVKNVTRIVNGSSPDEGLMEVLVNDQWRSVCNYGWSKYDADVACKSLGYIGGIPFSLPILREGREDTWFLANLNCNGNEDSLLECWSTFTTCKNGEQAGAVCYREENDVTRIVNGSSPNEGVVEVLINDQWRSVCNNRWDKRKTDPTCKILGYSGGFPVSSTLFVEDKEEMWMLDVSYCSGNVKSSLKCSLSLIRSSSCHGGKAGVVCYHAENGTFEKNFK
ncbi:neurotrypsin-like [Saccostrea cucullata]|uniref:neurotrypsin-like n=1 Tax=Saccostrea cuccullata TaxID=36930 RepID=UPI002ED46A1F